ncbi:MAG: hypothetical protein LBJ91_01860 [Clostridiales Family XIII bacterium]|jgi:hypothetical protein|nr:hypothetical protein [Clostridiales Family XIII bacterium]
MKQFIVLLATLPLVLGLLMQIGLAQGNFALTVRAESIVRDCREYAADAGGFSDAIREEMAERLAEATGTPPTGIYITADETPDADGVVRYRVEIPIRRLVAAPTLFGIATHENSGNYVIEGMIRVRTAEDPPTEEDEPSDEDEYAAGYEDEYASEDEYAYDYEDEYADEDEYAYDYEDEYADEDEHTTEAGITRIVG